MNGRKYSGNPLITNFLHWLKSSKIKELILVISFRIDTFSLANIYKFYIKNPQRELSNFFLRIKN